MSFEYTVDGDVLTCVFDSKTGMSYSSNVSLSDYKTEEDAKGAAREKVLLDEKEYTQEWVAK